MVAKLVGRNCIQFDLLFALRERNQSRFVLSSKISYILMQISLFGFTSACPWHEENDTVYA